MICPRCDGDPVDADGNICSVCDGACVLSDEVLAVPCPPTPDAVRVHYQRCIDFATFEEHKQEFRDELAAWNVLHPPENQS